MAAYYSVNSHSSRPFSLLLLPSSSGSGTGSGTDSGRQLLNLNQIVSFPLRVVRNSPPPLKIHSLRDPKASVVTAKSWNTSILNSETPVLVEFYASWCGPCQMVHRVIDEIATEYAGKLKCFTLNADMDLEIAEDYEIKAVPVVLLFKNGVKCDSVVGTMPKEFYTAAIDRVLASS